MMMIMSLSISLCMMILLMTMALVDNDDDYDVVYDYAYADDYDDGGDGGAGNHDDYAELTAAHLMKECADCLDLPIRDCVCWEFVTLIRCFTGRKALQLRGCCLPTAMK